MEALIKNQDNDAFCIVPFVHLSSSPLGTLRPCCFSSHEKISKNGNSDLYNLGKDSLESIWNSQHYKEIRSKMINGEKLANCGFCYKEEESNKRSKRIKENKRYEKYINARIDESIKNKGALDSMPLNLDLRLGNLCNLKCISCNPVFSSQVETEMEKSWPDDFFLKKEFSTIEIDNSWFENNVFRENINKLLPELEFIYVSGGEPVINNALIDFLQRSILLGYAKNQSLRFNTNLLVLNKSFFNMLEEFNEVDVSVSIDAIGEDLKIIRYPSSFEKISKNIEKVLSLKGNVKLTINCTVSLLNIFSIKDLYLWIDDLSKKYKTYIHISVDLVHEPVFLSLPYLRKSLKKQALEEIDFITENVKLKTAALNDLISLKDVITKNVNDYDEQKGKLIEYINVLEQTRSIPIFDSLLSLRGLNNG